MDSSFVVRPYKKGEEKYVAEAHKKVYFEEYNWGPAFSDYAGRVACDYAASGHGAGEGFWIAEAEGRPVGSIMLCRTDDAKTGQLRLFLVDKPFRRKGIGAALLDALMKAAGEAGYERMMLWTASPLKDAIRQYEGRGFAGTERTENTEWSLNGELLYEIKMELSLR